MPMLLIYGVVALAILGALGGIGYKVRESGKDSVRVEWAAANAEALQKAEADRRRQDELRATQDKEATRRLANARKSSQQLTQSLEAQIRVAGSVAQCPVPGSLLESWNSANKGGESGSPGAVLAPSGATTPAR